MEVIKKNGPVPVSTIGQSLGVSDIYPARWCSSLVIASSPLGHSLSCPPEVGTAFRPYMTPCNESAFAVEGFFLL
jgi:hypothetical protein